MNLTLYGQHDEKGWPKTVLIDDLIAMQRHACGDLFAKAEDSGNESCFVEVARWNYESQRWERYAYAKCMDYRFPEAPEASDEQTAEMAADKINRASFWGPIVAAIIGRMPTWQSDDSVFPNLTKEERGMTERVKLADGRTVDLPEVVLKCLKERFTREGERAAKLQLELESKS